MVRYIGLLSLILAVGVYGADSYRTFELKYRDPVNLQVVLSSLVSEQMAVTVDGNQLLVRGPAAELNSLVSVIKSLDRPLMQLQVKIYRGSALDSAVNPGANVQRWTTDGGNNNVDTVIITEGTPLAITADSLYPVALENYRATGEVKSSEEKWRQDYKTNRLLALKESAGMTLNLLSQDTVAADILVYRHSPQKIENQQQPVNHKIQLQRNLPLNQWISLIEQSAIQFRPSLTSNRQVVSTGKQGKEERVIWIYISPVQ